MHICMYICIYIYIYIYIHICIHDIKCRFTFCTVISMYDTLMLRLTDLRMSAAQTPLWNPTNPHHISGWARGFNDICIYIYIYICMCVYIYIYIYNIHDFLGCSNLIIDVY